MMSILLIIQTLIILNFQQKSGEFFSPSVDSAEITQSQQSLFESYDVLTYNLELKIDPVNESILASCTVVFEPLSDMTEIQLHFAGLSVDSVFVSGRKSEFRQTDQLLITEFLIPVEEGIHDSISIYYQGKPQRGLYFRENQYGDKVVYTHNEPYDAHFWFPCKDIPSDKAQLILKIEYPDNFTSVSNGLKTYSVVRQIGWLHDTWIAQNPIATYLVAFALGPFDIIENIFSEGGTAMPVQYYIYPQDRQRGMNALNTLQPMLRFYSDSIGAYPFINEKYAMVEVPLQEASAMENQTCTMMREQVIDDREIIAHELAHHWWGNAITPTGFTDIWLNEGFATYFDALFTEYHEGEVRFKDRLNIFRGGIFQDGSVADPIGNPPENRLFSAAVYLKGAWILHMLRHQTGDTSFWQIMREYFNRYKYGNVSTADFQSICEEISGIDLDYFFNQWLYRGGIPSLNLSWTQVGTDLNFTIEQVQAAEVYILDVEVAVRGINNDTVFTVQSNSRNDSYMITFSEPVISVELDPDGELLNQNNSPVYLIPESPQIGLIYPNPFNSRVTILVQLERTQSIEISIWNVLGEKVERLFSGRGNTGVQKIIWNAENRASGLYFCRMDSESSTDMKKLMLIK